jgi:2-methylcitrate dehydratase PrpD
MGGLHAAIDAVLALQAAAPIDPAKISHIRVDVSDAAFQHGGFDITRPIEPITAQMSLKYTTPAVILDHAALIAQYRPDRINRDVWDLIAKTEVTHEPAFDDGSDSAYTTRVTLTAPDGSTREQIVTHPRGGLDNPLSDDEIVAKYRMLTEHVVESGRRDAIQEAVLDLEISPQGPRQLMALLAAPVAAALA